MKWKWIILIACVAVLAVLCIPRRFEYKDGGSYGYEAVLYRVTYYHGMLGQETDESGDVWLYTAQERVKAKPGEWWEFGGTEVQILGFTVYSNTGLRKVVEASETQGEQTAALTGEAAATESPAGNPYFTCTGTEYGQYPIIPPEERKAEALAFLNENRDALERAAKVALETGELTEIQYHLYGLTGTGMGAKICKPEPEFVADAEKYLAFSYPMAIDTTQHDPGILYYVALIYTTNTAEQISEFYRHDVEPIDGNWYIETYFYAY